MRILDQSIQRRLDAHELFEVLEALNENSVGVFFWDYVNRVTPDAASIVNTLEDADREAVIYHKLGGDLELVAIGTISEFRSAVKYLNL